MNVKVLETPVASLQANLLRGPNRKSYERFLDELSRSGCSALAYRVTGPEPLPRLCVKHLRGANRVVVAFDDLTTAWIVLVGQHVDSDPGRNVYDMLYELAGAQPLADEKRRKPSCCSAETGRPLGVSEDIISDMVQRARTLVRKARS